MTAVNLTTKQLQNIMQAAITAVGTNRERPNFKNPERSEVELGFSETQWAFFVDE